MNTKIIIEGIGYLGSLLVVVSMLMTSVKKLRIVNSVGSVIFAGYALLIHSYPTAIMNAFLVGINVYNLLQLSKQEKNYNVISCYKDESIVQKYLAVNLEDIRSFFPGFQLDGGHVQAYLVCNGANPVGILIGNQDEQGRLQIEIDYTIPAYRDCSVGSFLLGYLISEVGITEFVFEKESANHEGYLLKMGFEASEKGFIKRG